MIEPGADQAREAARRMTGWRDRFLRFLDSGHAFSDDERNLCYKHRFINTVFLVAWLVVSCFGFWRLAVGDNLFVAVFDIVFGTIALGLMIALRLTDKSAVDRFASITLSLCFLLFGTVYVAIVDAVRSGPFLLITASAFFLKGPRIGTRWAVACIVLMLAVETLPAPYAKGGYSALTSSLDIVCLILLLLLYESQKKNDAEALRVNEEKFRTIFQSSNDAIFLIHDGRLAQWNASAPMLFHCPEERFRGCRLADLLAPDTPPETFAALAAAEQNAEHGSPPLELLLQRQDGSGFYANIRLTPVTIGGNRMLQAIVRDIDARKRSELKLADYRDELEQRVRERTQRLEESELRFSRLLELTEEGIFVHENGIIIDVTNAFCRLTGYVKHELIGRDFLPLLVAPEQWDTVRAYIAAAATHKYDLTVVRANGSRIEVEAFGRAVDLAGRPLRAGVWRDITTSKETERSLLGARQAAEEATRAKSAFIANMSHEIRTPLNAIIGITHQLRRDIAEEGLCERLDRVDGAARHLLMVLTDILDVSKIEAGKLSLEQQPFSFRRLVDSVGDLIRDSAGQKGLSFRILVDERLPPVVVGDSTRLAQVLINLASNSVKFTEHGNVTLWISVIGSAPGSVTLRFRVSDTGIGMTPEQMSRLFHDFEQAESSITRRYGGTGLGLSISRRLVELMGGQIQVRSTPGTGSDFWFEIVLPVSAVALAEVERDVPETSAEVIRNLYHGARILLVEDTPINQEVALDLLNEAGLAADVADNGQQAVERVRDGNYDLVLMDLQMPILDGLGATRAIRALPDRQHLPIIAMTANAYAEDQAQCLQTGMNDYLAKPIEAAKLFAALARWLPAHLAESSAAAPSRPEPATPPTPPAACSDDARAIVDRLAGEHGFSSLHAVPLAQRKPERYLQLLDQLLAEHGADGKRLQQLLAVESPENRHDAQRIAHTLKGVAATFGMGPLATLAAHLHERLLSDSGPDALQPLLQELTVMQDMLAAQVRNVHKVRQDAERA